ncbi:hypothetical protein C0992_001046, partial [Termitomyces sp. T32_za158]
PRLFWLRHSRAMDNPQHYQPLSHALNPPQGHQRTYTGIFNSKIATTNSQNPHREEEEEEEEEDGDDEGLIEEQLNRHEPGTQSSPSSPQPKTTGCVHHFIPPDALGEDTLR